eukprot:121701-Rhodomonas_salina.1
MRFAVVKAESRVALSDSGVTTPGLPLSNARAQTPFCPPHRELPRAASTATVRRRSEGRQEGKKHAQGGGREEEETRDA